jgi:hypothetical protein
MTLSSPAFMVAMASPLSWEDVCNRYTFLPAAKGLAIRWLPTFRFGIHIRLAIRWLGSH